LNTEPLWAGADAPARRGSPTHGNYMLYTIVVVLLVLWLLGLVTSYTMGGVIHVLLVIALVMVLANFISGRRRSA
jgi:hypothetical protein